MSRMAVRRQHRVYYLKEDVVEHPFSVAGDRTELEPHVSDQIYPGRLRPHCVDGLLCDQHKKTNGNGSRSFPQRLASPPRIPPSATGAPPPVECNAASSDQPHKQQPRSAGNLPDCVRTAVFRAFVIEAKVDGSA